MRWVIGDVHGCARELNETIGGILAVDASPKIFLTGDLTDRGPEPYEVFYYLWNVVNTLDITVIRGNHDDKLMRALSHIVNDRVDLLMKMSIDEYLQATITEIVSKFKSKAVHDYLHTLPYYVRTQGDIVTHAYFSEYAATRGTRGAMSVMLYGKTDKDAIDEKTGFSLRIPWWEDYKGQNGRVIYGHYHQSSVLVSPHAVCVDIDTPKSGMMAAFNMDEDYVLYFDKHGMVGRENFTAKEVI